MRKKMIIIVGLSCLMSGTIIGATVRTKITAELLQMKVVKDNQQVLKDTKVISYNGSTYVPLRAFGEVTGTAINYKDGVIYLGNNNTIVSNTAQSNNTESISTYWNSIPSADESKVTKITESRYFNDRQKYIDKAHQLIKATLKDPMSAVFDYERDGIPQMWVSSDGAVVLSIKCRAKNSFGGYDVDSVAVFFENGNLNNYTMI